MYKDFLDELDNLLKIRYYVVVCVILLIGLFYLSFIIVLEGNELIKTAIEKSNSFSVHNYINTEEG